ncbi:hypothetical protein PIROE2DRAFT_62568 [Piromyces sp. E2]|nr:hypothetical protein PIROE2DRAFT_62568 [Piromyces sp. E2]|eukprot:OUM61339.1 hypothetical protein PIROE2DRAFT_62568 [Piromyces sp. E2]
MLVAGLTEETVFAKDIAEFSDKLNKNFNDYDPENILVTIYDILKYPVKIEWGYVDAIKQVNELYFGFSENGEEPTKYKLNLKGNENIDTNVNQFDELSEVQRKAVKDILYETPLYLHNIRYNNDISYKALLWYTKSMHIINFRKIEPIIRKYIKLLKQINEDKYKYITVSKIYWNRNKNKGVEAVTDIDINKENSNEHHHKEGETVIDIDINKEKIYYIKEKELFQEAEKEYFYICDDEEYHFDRKLKVKFLIPKYAEKAYVVSKDEVNKKVLINGQTVFVAYEGNAFEIINFKNKRSLKVKKHKKHHLHLCKEIGASSDNVNNENQQQMEKK